MIEATMEQLYLMKLFGMADGLKEQMNGPEYRNLGFEEISFGDALHIFTFAFRARSREHRVDIESEDPKRGAAVIDIFGREGYHLSDTTNNHHCSFRPGRKENVKM